MGKYSGIESNTEEEYKDLMLLQIANELAELNRLKRLELSKSGIGTTDQA